ncbi:MAG: ankryin, partial [Spirochaetes bacterium]|nr:ankryin [Spirochaetota bacterium]
SGENGGTVLMTAALFNRNPEVIEYLLDAGAEPGHEDVHGNTAWDYVQMNRQLAGTEAFELLKDLSDD